MAHMIPSALATIGTMMAGKGIVKALDSPKIPKQEAPLPDDKTKNSAAQKAMQRKFAETGRAGTMLTDGDSKLG